MKTAYLSIAALAFLIQPAQALTLEQAMAEIAGYYCSGSTCTTEIEGTREQRAITGRRGAKTGLPIEAGRSSVCFFGNGWPMIDVNPKTCTSNSLLLSGGGPIWGTQTIPTLTTITKELIYNGPNTSRDLEWTVNVISETTVDCPCAD